MTKPNDTTTTTPTAADRAAKRQKRVVQLLEAYLSKGGEVGAICDQRDALLKRARRNGLRLHQPIQLSNGELYQLRKPEGKYVHFANLELKKVPKNPRSPRAEPQIANTAEAAL